VKIGLLGTGLVDRSMGLRLLAQNVSLVAYNRTATKLQLLQEKGATVTDSPEVAIYSAIIESGVRSQKSEVRSQNLRVLSVELLIQNSLIQNSKLFKDCPENLLELHQYDQWLTKKLL
jgi:hypothetical protein